MFNILFDLIFLFFQSVSFKFYFREILMSFGVGNCLYICCLCLVVPCCFVAREIGVANYVELCAIYEIRSKNLKVHGIILLQFMFKSGVERKRRCEVFQ